MKHAVPTRRGVALFLQRHESIIRRRYGVRRLGAHHRMQWDRHAASLGVERAVGIPVRVLNNDDRRDIRELQNAASPDTHFDERTLSLGRVTGAFADKRLVAIATCHVYSRQYSVAAIGAVATHPDYRSHGYATAVTKAPGATGGSSASALCGVESTFLACRSAGKPQALRGP